MNVNTHLTPLAIIYVIRESFYGSEHVYTQGSCYQFYEILKLIFPGAQAYSNGEHVITRIDNIFYDIEGMTNPDGYEPVKLNDPTRKTKFDFWNCGLECPSCDEIVCYSGLKTSAKWIDKYVDEQKKQNDLMNKITDPFTPAELQATIEREGLE